MKDEEIRQDFKELEEYIGEGTYFVYSKKDNGYVNINTRRLHSEITGRYHAFVGGYKARDKQLQDKLKVAREALELFAHIKDAYPEDIFPPIGKDTYHQMCSSAGMPVDRVSAHVLRILGKEWGDIAEKALKGIGEME